MIATIVVGGALGIVLAELRATMRAAREHEREMSILRWRLEEQGQRGALEVATMVLPRPSTERDDEKMDEP